jgi:isopenicillin N synthase-like dioxygenase
MIGSSQHTDWGFLTLIMQDETGGLEAFYKD